MKSLLKQFLGNRDGAVAIVAAVALPALIGTVALVAEFGHGLLTKAENQRVADLAAYAGALALSNSGSTDDMDAAVASVAELNGVPAAGVRASRITSPRGNGSDAVSVIVSTENVLLLAPIVGADSSLPISASAAAEFGGGVPGCIIALNPGQSGVTLSGGTRITAADCGVSSNSTITVPCGTEITARSVTFNSAAAPSEPCDGIQSEQLARTAVDDPLADHEGVTAGRARLLSVAAQTGPSLGSVTIPSGPRIEFPWWADPNFPNTVRNLTDCDAGYASGWEITCPAGQAHNFGELIIRGNEPSRFVVSGSSSDPTVFNFSGAVSTAGVVRFPSADAFNFAKGLTITGGSSVSFGDGDYHIAQGIETQGGTTLSFGAGDFHIGRGTVSCSGATYSICHKGTTLTFGGPSRFVLPGGVYNNGGSTMTLGSGTMNSFDIGPSSAGNAVWLGGGSKTSFADAFGADGFRLTGNLHAPSGGGSCLRVSAADQHDIKGYVSAAGGVIFGSGVYTIDGYMAFGASNGGDVSCWGEMIGVSAIGTMFFVSGSSTACAGGRAFCVGAGYGTVKITAPEGGDMANLAVVGPAAPNTAGALFTAGASNTQVSGAFYFPSGPIDLSGGAGLGSGEGECLQLIGSRISMSGGTAIASACVSNMEAMGGVVLVQ